jgi:hypothetical protein
MRSRQYAFTGMTDTIVALERRTSMNRRKRVSRETPRNLKRREAPICPVCVKPIEVDERISGWQDALLHERCDYLKGLPFRRMPRRIA